MRNALIASTLLGFSSLLSAADPQLLNLAMPDAQVVAGVNVTKAKTSPFGQFILRQLPPDGDFAKFVSMSGFDPRRDLQEILMASPAGQDEGLVAVRGSFDAARIATLATADGKHAVASYKGVELITPTTAEGGPAIAILDSNFAVMGNVAVVKAAVDRRSVSAPISAELAAKVAMYGASDAWTVSLVPLSGLGTPKDAGPLAGVLQGDLLKKVTQTSGSVTFDSPVRITGELTTDTGQDATALGDVVKFLASMVQTSGGSAGAPVATLVQSLTVNAVGNILKLGLSIPEAQLEALIQSAGKDGAKKKGSVKI